MLGLPGSTAGNDTDANTSPVDTSMTTAAAPRA